MLSRESLWHKKSFIFEAFETKKNEFTVINNYFESKSNEK
jgi:hypothetical protein